MNYRDGETDQQKYKYRMGQSGHDPTNKSIGRAKISVGPTVISANEFHSVVI